MSANVKMRYAGAGAGGFSREQRPDPQSEEAIKFGELSADVARHAQRATDLIAKLPPGAFAKVMRRLMWLSEQIRVGREVRVRVVDGPEYRGKVVALLGERVVVEDTNGGRRIAERDWLA